MLRREITERVAGQWPLATTISLRLRMPVRGRPRLVGPAGGVVIGEVLLVRLPPVMGCKRVLSREPSDTAGFDVLEVELEPVRELQQSPVGCWVTVQIKTAS